jgi:hypothetical protein
VWFQGLIWPQIASGWSTLSKEEQDWDYFDEQSLDSVAALENGGFRKLSGQVYKAIVLPSMTVITRTGLLRLKEFAQQGDKVIFLGKTPTLIFDRTFLNAKDVPDLSFATLIEPSGEITPRVIAALPKPDVKLDQPFQRLTYSHRTWSDGDLYFLLQREHKNRVARRDHRRTRHGPGLVSGHGRDSSHGGRNRRRERRGADSADFGAL